jgi:hypothetical protein
MIVYLIFLVLVQAIYIPIQRTHSKITESDVDHAIAETAGVIAAGAADAIILSLDGNLTLPLNFTTLQLGNILFPDPFALGGLGATLGEKVNEIQTRLVTDLRPSLEETLKMAAERYLVANATGSYSEQELRDIHDQLMMEWTPIITKDIMDWRDTTLLDWINGIKGVWDGIHDLVRGRLKKLEDVLKGRLNGDGGSCVSSQWRKPESLEKEVARVIALAVTAGIGMPILNVVSSIDGI